MGIEARLLECIRELPLERQTEVLDFVEFIQRRSVEPEAPRPIGLCSGEFSVPDDFDAPLPEDIIEAFEL